MSVGDVALDLDSGMAYKVARFGWQAFGFSANLVEADRQDAWLRQVDNELERQAEEYKQTPWDRLEADPVIGYLDELEQADYLERLMQAGEDRYYSE